MELRALVPQAVSCFAKVAPIAVRASEKRALEVTNSVSFSLIPRFPGHEFIRGGTSSLPRWQRAIVHHRCQSGFLMRLQVFTTPTGYLYGNRQYLTIRT